MFNKDNKLIIRIQPDEGILVKFGVKVPGQGFKVERANLDFYYSSLAENRVMEAYERLLLDAMQGDATLYARADEVEAAWEFVDPILDYWKNGKDVKVYGYSAGVWGPINADDFIDDGSTLFNTKIKWQYTLDETLKDFMIYRMITSGTMIQYKVVTLEEAMNYDPSAQDVNVQGDLGLNPFQFVDENLEPGRRYSYQVVARHTNGTNSNKSKMVTIKIP